LTGYLQYHSAESRQLWLSDNAFMVWLCQRVNCIRAFRGRSAYQPKIERQPEKRPALIKKRI